jgi:methionyl-tRNA formyltransferase
MRLIVNGQQAFGKAVLEALLDRQAQGGDDEVVAVFCAPDKEGRPVDPIKEAALARGVPLYQPASYKTEETLEQLRSLKADLMVMAYVIIFVPEAARDIPTHGSICFHPSLLPLHRGPSSINWPIIGGATKTGLTVFYPNDGLDEGDILLQKEVTIEPDDTLGTVYFQKIFQLGVDAMLESVDLIKAGQAPRIKQDDSKATYESWCRKADAEIDWSKPVDDVYNLIRGTNPQPGAWTRLNGQELQIFDSVKRSGAGGKPGEVTAVGPESFTVAAPGGLIEVKRLRPAGGGKVAAGEFAASSGLRPGTMLG